MTTKTKQTVKELTIVFTLFIIGGVIFYKGYSEALERSLENPCPQATTVHKPAKSWATQLLETYAEYGEYDGHQYLVVPRRLNSREATMAITHSPKCWCLTNRLEKIENDY